MKRNSGARVRRRQARTQDRKRQLVEIAYRLIADKGFGRLSNTASSCSSEYGQRHLTLPFPEQGSTDPGSRRLPRSRPRNQSRSRKQERAPDGARPVSMRHGSNRSVARTRWSSGSSDFRSWRRLFEPGRRTGENGKTFTLNRRSGPNSDHGN